MRQVRNFFSKYLCKTKFGAMSKAKINKETKNLRMVNGYNCIRIGLTVVNLTKKKDETE